MKVQIGQRLKDTSSGSQKQRQHRWSAYSQQRQQLLKEGILIGAVIAMGSADRDGRLHPGDELVYVDGIPVAGKTHRYVIDLMHHAARNGQVNLTVRRKVLCGGEPCPENGRSPGSVSTHHSSPRSDYATYTNTYSNSNHAVPTSNASPPEGFASHSLQTSDVVIHRKENEGFGFVIISSLNRPESGSTITVPHKIGRIIDGSPADRCAKLKVGDRILAVNGQSIINMPHADIVKLIKDAGLSVTLRIIPQEGFFSPWKTPKPIMDRWENQGSPQTSLSAPAIPQNLPFPPALHRSSFPDSTEAFDPRKPDPYELYEKSRAIYESRRPDYKELDVHLRRMESGFGFRILGGDEPGQPILIGAVIAMGSADRDGRLHPGDELVYVDGIPVAGKTHRYVIDLMHHAARNGQVNLTVRRKVLCGGEPCPENGRSPGSVSTHHSSPRSDYATYTNTYSNSNHAVPTSNASPPEGFASHSLQTSDVVIHRKENEGFGFVIISSLNRPESGSTITVPHKIGRIIDGSPADRCAKLKVGDRILAVNGQSIINMPHADIVKLIKDAGLSVTLRIIPQEELNSPASAPSSEKQSPLAQQHSPLAQQSPLAQPSPATPNSPIAQPAPPQPLQPQGHENSYRSEVKARQDVKPDIRQPPFTDYRQPPLDYRQPPGGDYPQPPPLDYRQPPLLDYRQHSPDTRQFPLSDYRQPQDFDYFTVDMEKGAKGFGFSIRGGREYKMDLYVLRLAEDGPAIRNGRMRVGDQIIEINGESTRDMTHARAIELIKSGGRRVRLLLKRGTGQVPEYDEPGSWSAPAAASPGLPEVGVSLEDVLSPFSPSHPAPPSDPSHQTNPDPTWDIKREHDVRKPKELSAGSQKKQRLGEQSERSASPQRAVQPGLEEAPGGQGQPEAGRPSSETRAPGPALAEAARAGNKEGLQAPVGSELSRHGGPGAAPAFVEGRAGARAGSRQGSRPPGGAPARKAAVAPGPWKVPGSDKLPGVLKPGASAPGR
nr:PREDICTED: membrane-associated guanylate kinase, WW and PDZ domain-containing protein 2-like [Bos indicus]